jgi:transcriptional regulator with XRE-family HTH domain
MSPDHEQFLRNLGQVIRQARKSKKMTQGDLSELSGMNAKYLGEIELGKTNPTIVFLLRLAWALGLEIVDIFPVAHDSGREGALIYFDIVALLRKLDRPDLHKLYKVLQLFVDERRS